MRARKERLTVTVDRWLVEAANAAVAAGRADSLSAWVNLALAEQAAKERRLAALAALISEYEAKHGVITDAELAAQQRADRRNAIVIRGSRRPARRPRRSKAA
jgi:hypothetical protein